MVECAASFSQTVNEGGFGALFGGPGYLLEGKVVSRGFVFSV